MRIEDVVPELRPYLRPVEGRPNVRALAPPPVPRQLPATTGPYSLNNASMALGRLAGALAHFPNADLLTRTLARREAVQSSQIEGTTSGLDDLLTYEITHTAEGRPADVRVTLRYVEALQHGLAAVRAGGRRAITTDLLNELHQILMQGARDNLPRGRYRDDQVWIGAAGGRIEDATFVPAPPADIADGMRELQREMLQYQAREEEHYELSLVAQIAIAHAQFETIHPYEDGNGRVGRLLMPLILAAHGHPPLYLSGTLLRHRPAYYAALNSIQLRAEWRPWLSLLGQAVIESVDDTVDLAVDLAALVSHWGTLTAKSRRDSVARRLPPELIGMPVVSVKDVAQRLGVSVRAAQTGVDQLVEYGVLTPSDERRWGRAFHATAVIERLNRPPGRRGRTI